MELGGEILIGWLVIYLDRTQKTKVNGLVSSPLEVVCGVPQGSILGPLMFLLYVNDLPKCVKNSSIKLYADDTVIYDTDRNIANIEGRLQASLDMFSMWSSQNKLTVNASENQINDFYCFQKEA